jgi:hypothetical protein
VVGHNVFFTYLYAGAADVYLENGDQTLWPPLDRLWNDLTQKKMCINGGVSPMGHGLSKGNDPVCEALGPPYFLPCADCYNETCGQIGNLMWNSRPGRCMQVRPFGKFPHSNFGFVSDSLSRIPDFFLARLRVGSIDTSTRRPTSRF